MRKRRYCKSKAMIKVLAVFLIVSTTLAISFFKIKPLVYTVAKSNAETILLDAANSAVVNVLKNEDISYSSIAKISKNQEDNITGLEIDVGEINLLKSLISGEISNILAKKEFYPVVIPLGTFFGSEYTTGLGPRIKFSMQVTSTAIVDFKSNFYDAGINQVLHQILITIKIYASVVMLGFTTSFSVNTSAIAAQTVIVGITPDAFTSVIENAGSNLAGDIFDYGSLETN